MVTQLTSEKLESCIKRYWVNTDHCDAALHTPYRVTVVNCRGFVVVNEAADSVNAPWSMGVELTTRNVVSHGEFAQLTPSNQADSIVSEP